MDIRQTLLALTMMGLVLSAAPVAACGDGECDPPPPPATPRVITATPDADPDPHTPGQVIHFALCCAEDGNPTWRTALFRDPVQAALQCQARALRYDQAGQSLPECPRRKDRP
jgi:hypothetical protein